MRVIDIRRSAKIAVSLVYYLVRAVCRALFRLLGRPLRQRLTILYYHGVTSDFRSHFVRQMEALHRGAIVVPAAYRGKLPIDKNRKNVAITFDDAFVSIAANALPELDRYSFHSTIFVPVGWLGRTPGWSMKAGELGLAEAPELSEVVMSSDQLQCLSRSLVSLGSHTMTHPMLSELEPERAREEVHRSRQLLAELSGREVLEFSFPYGAYNEATVALCRAAAYETVYSIIPEEVDTTDNQFVRGRTKTDPSDGPLEFFLKFNGAYEWMGYSVAAKNALKAVRNTIRRSQPFAARPY